jgi:D-aminoacyl-tRNA deacylase
MCFAASFAHPGSAIADLANPLNCIVRAVVQRVSEARVEVDEIIVGEIGQGLCVLLGVSKEDGAGDAEFLAEKIRGLRVFEDTQGKMNRSLLDTGGELLVVSQFTLYGDCRKGNRPSFTNAAPAEQAERLYRHFTERLHDAGIKVATGQFKAHMKVSLVNDGPVTLILDS